MHTRYIFPRIGLDIAAWFALPAAFLFAYVTLFSAPSVGVLPHFYLVGLAFLALVTLRLAMFWMIPAQAWAQLAASLLTSAMLAVMIVYYCLVLIGIQSWGRVISWDLITSYSSQIPQLLDALEIPFFIAASGIALAYMSLLAATWFYLGKFDWTPRFSSITSRKFQGVLVFSGCLLCFVQVNNFTIHPWVTEGEPVSLTLFPTQSAWSLMGNSIDKLGAARQDQLEDETRTAYSPNLQADRKNVILIVVDALRPDHMGMLGYDRDTTPNLSRRVPMSKSVSLHSTCGDSACGLLSLASSKFVHQFSYRPITLQEVLKIHGYAVHMILSGDHTNFYGLRKIYGKVDSYYDGASARNYYMNDDQLVLDYLDKFPTWNGTPVMIQFHLMSSHVLRKNQESRIQYTPAANYLRPENRTHKSNKELDQKAINFYDNGVYNADAVINDVLNKLVQKDYMQNTIVVITADHGEALGEHGLYMHANSVQEELLRIPFIMIPFGHKPLKHINQKPTNSQVDIAPTILAELDIPRPKTWAGSPLQETGIRNLSYFQQGWDVGLIDYQDRKSLFKYWINTKTGKEKVFNLSADPNERLNLSEKVPLEHKRGWRLRVLPGATSAYMRPIEQ